MNWNQISEANRSTVGAGRNCGCCGAVVSEGYDSCRAMFNVVLEREYSDPAYGEVHLFTVDAYALQHSEQHGPRSNAFHLMRLCWLVEHQGDANIRQVRASGRGADHAREAKLRQFPFLKPPATRGQLKIVSVLEATNQEEHHVRVRAWRQSVWDAFNEHHAWARSQALQWFGKD